MSKIIRASTRDVVSRSRLRRVRDEGGSQRILVAEFSADSHVAEVIDDRLSIFILTPLMDMNTPTNGVTAGPPREAVEAQVRQAAQDRAKRLDAGAQLRTINQKNRDFWGRQNGGVGR